MKKLSIIWIAAGVIALILSVGLTGVFVYQQHARLDQRIKDIQKVGEVYSYLDFETRSQFIKEDLRPQLPDGFPIDQYEFLPTPTNSTGLTAANEFVLVREAMIGEDGKRLKFYADGSVQIELE